MDPLSIISAVAGIATAGTALVSSLYTLVETVRNAPRQMRDVAKEMTSLTCVLEFLVEIISDGHKIATRHYLNGIKSVVKSIENTQNEIMDMIDDHSIINRLKWRKAKTLLEDIRAHQSTVSMQVAILNLGMLAKRDGHIKKASERRLRKQAESLVQASNACLEANREDTLHFVPPPPRPASPPVYGAAPGAEWYYGAPSPPRNSDSIGVEPSIPDYSGIPKVPLPDRVATSDNIKEQENKPPDAPRPPIIPGRSDSLPALPNTPQPGKSGSSADEATRKHTLMTYTHNSPGDAATLLYNLVFSSSGGDSGYESDQADPAPSDTHETEETWFSEDYDSSDGDVGDTIRRESRMASKRADRERRKGEENAAAGSSHPSGRKGQNLNGHNQPSMVVNRLLLKWTSLTNQEVEDTDSGVEDYAENDRLRSIRGTVAAIAARNNESGNNARTTVPESSFEYGSDSRDRVPPYAPYGEHGYTGYPQPWSYRPSPSINVPNGSARPPPPPTSHDTTGYDFYGNRNPYISPFMPNTGQNMQSNTQYPGYVTHNLAETKAPYSFKPPNVLILDRKSEIDEARDSSSVDNLAVRNKGFRVERQSSAEMIYHPASFLSMHGLEGEGILGALAASRSNAMYSELWLTLKHGFDLQIPYSRSSDVGETWFLGERPVFILFYHSSYQPQFFPLSKDDKIAFDRECVTIGEQWITDEALKQHGIVPRGKENGKLILDPDISTSELAGLVDLSQSLSWIEQRRRYAKTFYEPVDTFRTVQEHYNINLFDRPAPPISYTKLPIQKDHQPKVAKGPTELGITNERQPPQSSQTPEIKSEEPMKVEEMISSTRLQPQVQISIDKPDQTSPGHAAVERSQKKIDRERKHSPKRSRSGHPEDAQHSRSEQERADRRLPERRGSERERSEWGRGAKERPDRKRSRGYHRTSHRSSHAYTAPENRLDENGHELRRFEDRKSRENEPHRNPSSDSGISSVFSFLRKRT